MAGRQSALNAAVPNHIDIRESVSVLGPLSVAVYSPISSETDTAVRELNGHTG